MYPFSRGERSGSPLFRGTGRRAGLWHALLDKLVVLFLYVNVLAPTLELSGLRVSKVLFALIVVAYLVLLLLTKLPVPRMPLVYVFGTLFSAAILVCASAAIGNSFVNIMGLAGIFLFVLIIPVMLALEPAYGLERYLFHLAGAIVFLAVAYLMIYILCGPLDQRQLAELLASEQNPLASTMSMAFFPGGVRISLTNGGFLPPGLAVLFYALVRRPRLWLAVAFLVVAATIYLSYTLSLWGGALVGLIVVIVLCRRRRRGGGWQGVKMALFAAAAAAVCLIWGGLPEFIVGSKRESAQFKAAQLSEALNVFFESPMFGRGLGHTFHASDIQSIMGTETLLFENSYATVLAATGIVGVAVFAFVFGFYLLIFALRGRGDGLAAVLVAAHLAILVQAAGNPYLWSGGLALLFLCLLAVRLSSTPVDAAACNLLFRNHCFAHDRLHTRQGGGKKPLCGFRC
jgi:hypothetical protein